MRILVVEDAVERVEQFIEWLDNHEVVFMASAEKARAWLKDYACDVVLYTEFESQEALEAYAIHPAHLRVKG